MQHEHTARNFVLQLGSLITLYISLSSLIALAFGLITLQFPDELNMYEGEGAMSAIRFAIAMLVVFFPAYLVLTRYVNKTRRTETGGTYLALTKWLIYLSLLVGGGVLLGDLVAVVMSFLDGELTTRFLLKALTIFVVVGAAFVYYLLDVRGHWQKREQESVTYGALAAVIVVAAVVLGFLYVGSPEDRRAERFDQERVSDLQVLQSSVGEYYRAKQELPETLAEIESVGFGIRESKDPETNEAYEYRVLSATSFELCANFNTKQDSSEIISIARPFGGVEGTWEHDAGRYCFERTIDPDFFKPIQ